VSGIGRQQVGLAEAEPEIKYSYSQAFSQASKVDKESQPEQHVLDSVQVCPLQVTSTLQVKPTDDGIDDTYSDGVYYYFVLFKSIKCLPTGIPALLLLLGLGCDISIHTYHIYFYSF